MNRKLVRHDKTRKRDGMGAATHIFLHQAHIAPGLEVEPTCIKGDPLADESKLRV